MSNFMIAAIFAISINAIADDNKFSYYLNAYLKVNPSYRQALISEKTAKMDNKAGNLAMWMPSLSSSFSKSWSYTEADETTHTASKQLSLGLSGSLTRYGLSYSTTLYSDSRSESFFYGTQTTKSHTGSYSYSASIDLLRGNGYSVGHISFDNLDIAEKKAYLNRKSTLLSGTKSLLDAYINVRTVEFEMDSTMQELEKNEVETRKEMLKYKLGKIPRLNILNRQTQRENFKSRIISSKRSMIAAKKSLFDVIGKDFGEDERQKLSLEPIDRDIFDDKKIETWLAEKIEFKTLKNIDYIRARLDLQSTRLSIQSSKNNLLPSLKITGSKSYSQKAQERQTRPFQDTANSDSVSISFSMPIGFVDERNSYRKARMNYHNQVHQFKVTKQQILREWDQLKTDYLFALEELDTIKNLTEVARSRYQSALPTASLGSTYQDNILTYQTELLDFSQKLNKKLNDIFLLKVQMYTFHGDVSYIEKLKK